MSEQKKTMSETNVEDVKKQELADDTPKNQVDSDNPVDDLKDSDKNEENSMPSPQQEVVFCFNIILSSWMQGI